MQLLQSGDLLRGLVALALEVRRGTLPGLLGGGLGLLPQLLRGADRRGVQLVGLLAAGDELLRDLLLTLL